MAAQRALCNARGLPLRFVAPAEGNYERIIHEEGGVPTRQANWHDLFNALAWFVFPRTKGLLNHLHVEGLARQSDSRRSPARDVLTLFDESGMIVVCAEPELNELLRAFKWKELFWTRREAVRRHMRFHVFGHALHEQLLRPYKGITGKAIILDDAPEDLDAALCAYFESPQALESTRKLQPVPVLGIPDWWPENEHENYYDDTAYFRPGRRKKQGPL